MLKSKKKVEPEQFNSGSEQFKFNNLDRNVLFYTFDIRFLIELI